VKERGIKNLPEEEKGSLLNKRWHRLKGVKSSLGVFDRVGLKSLGGKDIPSNRARQAEMSKEKISAQATVIGSETAHENSILYPRKQSLKTFRRGWKRGDGKATGETFLKEQ